ncbi:hypothetical protein ACVW19_000491 [Streptomyces sp. TE5632]
MWPAVIGCVVIGAMPVPAGGGGCGNWLEPLGVCSLVIRGVVVMAVVALGGPVRLRAGRLVWGAKPVAPGFCPGEPGSGPSGEPSSSP